MKEGCIFAATYLPRFPSDQRAQGKFFFISLWKGATFEQAYELYKYDSLSVHVHSLPQHARLLCPLHHPLSVGHHQPQQYFPNQAEVAVGRIPTGECVGDGVPCGMGERGVVEVAR